MSFSSADTRPERLGFFGIDDIAALVGGARLANTLLHDVSGMFGNSSADQDRADRLNYVANAVLARSVYAGRVMLGGLTPNGIGASSERSAWQAEYQTLLRDAPDTMAQAAQLGPVWHYGGDTGSHPLSPQTRQEISNDLRLMGFQYPSNGQYVATPIGGGSVMAPSSSSPRAQVLAPVQTTAPFNYVPYALGGAALLGVILLRRR